MAERDPLRALRGDPTLNSVWECVLAGQTTQAQRAALIRHYRAERARYQTKESSKEPDDDE